MLLNICIEKIDVKCWLVEMTLAMTSVPSFTWFQCLFTFTLCFALIGGNLTAQSTWCHRGILGQNSSSRDMVASALSFSCPPGGVLGISSDGDDRRFFWGFEIFDSGIFLGTKIWQEFFGVA